MPCPHAEIHILPYNDTHRKNEKITPLAAFVYHYGSNVDATHPVLKPSGDYQATDFVGQFPDGAEKFSAAEIRFNHDGACFPYHGRTQSFERISPLS